MGQRQEQFLVQCFSQGQFEMQVAGATFIARTQTTLAHTENFWGEKIKLKVEVEESGISACVLDIWPKRHTLTM